GGGRRQLLQGSAPPPAAAGAHLLALCLVARLPARPGLLTDRDRIAQPGHRDQRRPVALSARARAIARIRRRDSDRARDRRLAVARPVRRAVSAAVSMDGLERRRLRGGRTERFGYRRPRVGQRLPLGRLCRALLVDAAGT